MTMIILLLIIIAITTLGTYLFAVLCRDVNDIYLIIERLAQDYMRSHRD